MYRPNAFARLSLSVGAAVMATSVAALPTEKGRSADVYTNAVRYLIAEAGDPMARPPKARPEVADLTTVAVAVPAAEQIFAVPLEPRDLATVNFAGAMDDVVFKLPLEPRDLATVNVSGALEDEAYKVSLVARDVATINFEGLLEEVAFGVPLEPRDLTSLAVKPATYDEAFSVSLVALDLPQLHRPATFDDAHAVPLEARSLASLEVPEALKTPAFLAALESADTPGVTAVAFGTAPMRATAGSSRIVDPAAADVTLAAAATQTDSDALMDDLIATDSNLTMRKGEGDRPDTMMMSSDVLFAFGKAALAPEAEETLRMITEKMASVSQIEVFGHTDAIGNEVNNLALGQKRAEVVRDWLLANSTLSAEQVIAVGVGEVDPIAANFTADGDDNPDGRALNRRVEFAFQ